jgi:hypothetical protein
MTDPVAVIFARQRRVLRILSWVLAPVALFTRRLDWVVGPTDVAQMASHIAEALPRSYVAVHARNPFYAAARYDAVVDTPSTALGGRWATWRRLYGGAVLLAWLVNRARGFIYVGGAGFLENSIDEREFEFAFLRRRHRRLVCYFTGNDIRSPRLMAELAERTGYPNLGTAVLQLDPLFGTEEYERSRRRRAEVADRHSDVVFNSRVDQMSYLTSDTEPFLYFYPDDRFLVTTTKFDAPEKLIVVHAPSKPVLKGTDHVRAAIRVLEAEREDFEYRELVGVDNEVVLAALDEAHIALNEFYAYLPGVFGIEALARRCVLVTSADELLEPDLPRGSNSAWVVTRVDQIVDHLRRLLDERAGLAAQAEQGWQWAMTHASATASASRLRDVLESRRP